MPIFNRMNVATLGNWLMDAEHRQLVVLMNEVEAAIASSEDEAAIRIRFEKLMAGAAMHFAHEDDSIRRSGFPDAERHIEQHRVLLQSLAAYAGESAQESNRRIRVGDAVRFLENWLIAHIDAADGPLAAHLRSNGST